MNANPSPSSCHHVANTRESSVLGPDRSLTMSENPRRSKLHCRSVTFTSRTGTILPSSSSKELILIDQIYQYSGNSFFWKSWIVRIPIPNFKSIASIRHRLLRIRRFEAHDIRKRILEYCFSCIGRGGLPIGMNLLLAEYPLVSAEYTESLFFLGEVGPNCPRIGSPNAFS